MQAFPVNQFVLDSLALINATGPGIPTNPDAHNAGVRFLNMNLDAHNANGNMIYCQTISTFPILAQKGGLGNPYTIGPATCGNPTPDFIIPVRPLHLEDARFQPSSVSPPINLPLKIYRTVKEYTSIVATTIASGVPSVCYLDNQWPVGNFYVWTEPNQGGNFVLSYWQPLPSNLTLLDTIGGNFPPGYYKMLTYELACSLAPTYGNNVPVDLNQIMADIKRDIAIQNLDSPWARYSVPSNGSTAYEGRTDTLYT